MTDPILRAAESLQNADALLVTAGAGMGVDSGLPDFRGNEGFWKAYPPMKHLGISFSEMANPSWFHRDPSFAWGFYGHRLNLYRKTVPHAGFEMLRTLAARMKHGHFVFTSNVDGAFQRAGFESDRVVECHGAIDYLQCMDACGAPITRADDVVIQIDEETYRAKDPLPACARCGALARPNILMFGDPDWSDARTSAQEHRFEAWLTELPADARLVIVESGAGTAIPTVRSLGDRVARLRSRTTLVRINVREPETAGQIEIALGAKSALEQITAALAR